MVGDGRFRWAGTIAAVGLWCAGCENNLSAPNAERPELFRVHGRIPDNFLVSLPTDPFLVDTNLLHAAILWAGVPQFSPYCQEHGPTPLDPDREIPRLAELGCRDPFLVVPGYAGPSVELDLEARTFDIVVDQLPVPDAMVGVATSRVAYGAVVIYQDTPKFMEATNHELDVGETLFASSFWTLTATQTRIAYVEGDFDRDSTFYPHPDCDVLPPAGFSLWEMGSLLERPDRCRLLAADEEVYLSSIDPRVRRAASCAPRRVDTFVRPPPAQLSEETLQDTECDQEGDLVLTTGVCSGIARYALAGCRDTTNCETPDWDLRDAPPSWWPCPVPGEQ